MNTELRNHHKATIHQSILECCADLLDNDDVVYHQLHLGVSDPVNREESELHIRMADAAYSEYEKTMFSDDTIQSCGLLPSELLKQNKEMRKFLNKINNDYKAFSDLNSHGYGEELEKLIESTEVNP